MRAVYSKNSIRRQEYLFDIKPPRYQATNKRDHENHLTCCCLSSKCLSDFGRKQRDILPQPTMFVMPALVIVIVRFMLRARRRCWVRFPSGSLTGLIIAMVLLNHIRQSALYSDFLSCMIASVMKSCNLMEAYIPCSICYVVLGVYLQFCHSICSSRTCFQVYSWIAV